MTQDPNGSDEHSPQAAAAAGARQPAPFQPIGVQPLHVQPIPAQPMPAPPPVDTLSAYRQPASSYYNAAPPPLYGGHLGYGAPTNLRPGILTAVGVMSIIVAAISVIYSLAMIATSFGMLMASAMGGAMTRTTTTVGPGGGTNVSVVSGPVAVGTTMNAGTAGANGTIGVNGMTGVATAGDDTLAVGGRGLPLPQRRTVIAGLGRVRSLTPEREHMLDALLADSGSELFPFDLSAGAVSPQMITNNVTESGRLPSATDRDGADFFILANGRLELYDDHAVFSPRDGGDTIRLSKDDIASASGLSANDIESVIARAQGYCGDRLTEPQIAALKTMLGAPGQTYVQTTASARAARGVRMPPAQQVYQATVDGDGTAAVAFSGGRIVLKSDGTLISAFSSGGAIGPGGVRFGPGLNPLAGVSRAAATTLMVASLLSMGLAIFLLVSAILVLRQHRRGRLLHNIYALAKLPLVIVAVWASYHLFSSMMRGMMTITGPGTGPGARGANAVAMVYASLAALGAIYPIALLIVFQTRGVRDYYNTVN